MPGSPGRGPTPAAAAGRRRPRLPMTLAASLLLAVLPQVFPGGDLKLPPRPEPATTEPEIRPASEIERFRRDLLEMQGPEPKVEQKLEEMGRAYPQIEALIVEVARTARASELINLMPVARRHGRTTGTGRVADELLFQLLARRLGNATGPVMEVMAELKGPDAKPALLQCVRARIPAVRRHAVDVLVPLVDQSDVQLAIELSREQSLDLQLRGVDLLQAIGNEGAVARLLELLSKDPALAAAAVSALIRLGPAAVPQLQQRIGQPVVDRSYVYAAFALAQIEQATGEPALPAALRAPLLQRLAAPEPLTRVLAAVPLADLVYRGRGAAGDADAAATDAALVDALLLVVEADEFVPNLDLLRAPAQERLLRHTGRVLAAAEPLAWRDWWKEQRATFLGVRAHVDVTADSVAAGIVTLRQEQRTIRVLGEAVAESAALPGAVEIVLDGERMLALVRGLESDGFGDPAAMRVQSALPRVRSLQLQVPGGRTGVAVPAEPNPAFDALVARVEKLVDAELWQLYRIAGEGPDRAAFWRAEQRWLDEHPEPLDRARRFLGRLLRGWAQWSPELQARAIAFVAAHPERTRLLREEDGEAAVAVLRQLPRLGQFDLQLLELAAAAPGDRVWRACIELAVRAEGGGREAVRAVFGVLGPDAVLAALGDENALVRRAAIDEITLVRDPRAGPRLIELLSDGDDDVARGAAFACGQLRIAAAERPLVDRIADERTMPLMRRECLRALGRVGGELAFPVLQRALTAPAQDDREAALRGLGELKDPRAAMLLAETVVVGSGQDLGEQARFHLQRQGALLAVPALRAQLPTIKDENVRAQLVLMLGLYQEPANVPDLMDLLRQPRYAGEAATMLEGTTGVDLAAVPDRTAAIEDWWRQNRGREPWQWLLDALAQANVSTSLVPEHFANGADFAPVVELARLVAEAPAPRLWVLSAAVLRAQTGQDYGTVTVQTPVDIREGIAARYRVLADTARAAQKR